SSENGRGGSLGDDGAEPAAKKTRGGSHKKSEIWDDFTVDAVDSMYVLCKHCDKSGNKGRIKRADSSTSSMHKHMNQVHPALMVSRGAKVDSTQLTMDSKVVVGPNFKRDSIFWMLMTYQPLSAQNNPWFRKMIFAVSSRANLTTRNFVYGELNKMEIAARKETVNVVGDKFFGGSTDIWTGRNRKMFISFTIHFVDGPVLRSIDLACRPFNKAHTGANIAQELKNIMVTTGLDPMKCTAITMDNASNMMKAGEILDAADDNKIVALSCFCHSIQLSIQRFLGLAKVKGGLPTTRATGG
ncbi:unnamed protein product, partial [Laminaria digitata]